LWVSKPLFSHFDQGATSLGKTTPLTIICVNTTLPTQRTYAIALMAGTEVDAMDSEMEEDDLLDDDMTMDDGNENIVPTPTPKLKSIIMGRTSWLSDGGPDNTKRRSFRKETDAECNSFFASQK
jgi:hypothetical protein